MKFSIAEPFMLFGPAFKKGLGPMLLTGLILYLGSLAVSLPLLFLTSMTGHTGFFGRIFFIGQALISYTLMAANWCAVTEITLANIANRPVAMGDVLRKGLTWAVPTLLVGILWFLGFLVGWILLLIPGLIFASIFATPIPALMSEKTGMLGCFGRARELTKGHRWSVFAIYLIVNFGIYLTVLVGALAVLGLTGTAFSNLFSSAEAGQISPLVIIPLSIVLGLGIYILMLVPPVMNTCLYAALRADKGESLTGNVAKVFE